MTRSIRYGRLLAASAFVSLSTLAVGGESASPPANMPFRYGQGYELFQGNCAECHGANLQGTEKGPPLLHAFYRPSHHSDAAFYRAIQVGSPQHHWHFGDMPPVQNVGDKQAEGIIEFVRWFQQDAGLY